MSATKGGKLMFRKIKLSHASRAASAFAVLCGGAVAGVLAGAPEASATGAGQITSVVFGGGYANPTVTIKGANFGKEPSPAVVRPCGFSGEDFAGRTTFAFTDKTGAWSAGDDSGGNGACIGVKIFSWSANKIIFTFGSAYNNIGTTEWIINSKDKYVVGVRGGKFKAVAP
jgi:hypothetical protein